MGRIKGPNVIKETLRVKPVWSSLHKDADALTSDGRCRAHYNDGEDVSADRVTHPGLRLEVDDRRRNNDAHRHNAVADDVKHRRVHIEIMTGFCLLGRWCRLSNLPFDSFTFSRCLGGLNPLRQGAARDGLVVALFRLVCVNVRHHIVALALMIVAMRVAVVMAVRMTVVMAVGVTVVVAVVVAVRMTVRVTVRVTVGVTVIVVVPAKVVVTFTRVKDLDLYQVEQETDNRHNQHDPTLDLWRIEEPLRGLNDQPECHDPHAGDADERANNFCTVPPIREAVRRVSLCEPKGYHRDGKAQDVGAQVRGVCVHRN